jgi:hypothetical protein
MEVARWILVVMGGVGLIMLFYVLYWLTQIHDRLAELVDKR